MLFVLNQAGREDCDFPPLLFFGVIDHQLPVAFREGFLGGQVFLKCPMWKVDFSRGELLQHGHPVNEQSRDVFACAPLRRRVQFAESVAQPLVNLFRRHGGFSVANHPPCQGPQQKQFLIVVEVDVVRHRHIPHIVAAKEHVDAGAIKTDPVLRQVLIPVAVQSADHGAQQRAGSQPGQIGVLFQPGLQCLAQFRQSGLLCLVVEAALHGIVPVLHEVRDVPRGHVLQRGVHEAVVIQPAILHRMRPCGDDVSRPGILTEQVLEPDADLVPLFFRRFVQPVDQHNRLSAIQFAMRPPIGFATRVGSRDVSECVGTGQRSVFQITQLDHKRNQVVARFQIADVLTRGTVHRDPLHQRRFTGTGQPADQQSRSFRQSPIHRHGFAEIDVRAVIVRFTGAPGFRVLVQVVDRGLFHFQRHVRHAQLVPLVALVEINAEQVQVIVLTGASHPEVLLILVGFRIESLLSRHQPVHPVQHADRDVIDAILFLQHFPESTLREVGQARADVDNLLRRRKQ